jgi:hypothetical protein
VDLGEVGFGVVIGFVWLRIGTSGGLLLHRNEHSGSIKDGKFVDCLSSVSFSRRILLHGVSYPIANNQAK